MGVVVIALLVHAGAGRQGDDRRGERVDSIQRARAAADHGDWGSALDALDGAATIAPLTVEEAQLRRLWEFRKILDLYCSGNVDELLSTTRQLGETAPSDLDAPTRAKAEQLLARRGLFEQLRALRDQQRDLAAKAEDEPSDKEACDDVIRDVQAAQAVRFEVLRKLDGDHQPGLYQIRDETGRVARLATTDNTFTTTGWTTLVVFAFDSELFIQLSDEHRAKARACLDARAQVQAALSAFAQSSKVLDAKIAAMSTEFISSCRVDIASPTPTRDTSDVASAAPPPAPEADATVATRKLDADDVTKLVNAQAASLTTTTQAFTDSFSNDAIAFFPHALAPLEGKARRAGSLAFAGAAIEQPSNVDTSQVTVGISGSIAWAATTWTLTLAGSNRVMPIRVTEVIRQGPTGLEVIAASFSVAPVRGATGIAGPVPSLSGGVPAGDGPEAWLASPVELSTHLLDDAMDASHKDAMSLFGSDPAEKAVGVEAVRRLLLAWKRIKLEIVGSVRVIDGDDYKVVLELARWPGPKPTLFRVLGVFVRGTGMVGPAPWQLVSAQYSVAVAN